MAGLGPAIHVLKRRESKDVDARDERGHDVFVILRNYPAKSFFSATVESALSR
jgi:hypothetical protein